MFRRISTGLRPAKRISHLSFFSSATEAERQRVDASSVRYVREKGKTYAATTGHREYVKDRSLTLQWLMFLFLLFFQLVTLFWFQFSKVVHSGKEAIYDHTAEADCN